MDYWRLGKAWFSEPWVLWALPSRPPKSAGPRQAFTRFAFTLAEILITLGIIGIVAALTMPSLVANYQEKAIVTKLKKIHSVMSQAYLQAVNEYGSPDGWDLIATDSVAGAQNMAEKLKPYLKILDETTVANRYKLADGSFVTFHVRNPECLQDRGERSLAQSCALLSVDFRDPSKYNNKINEGIDHFSFVFTKDGNVIPFGTADDTMQPIVQKCFAAGSNRQSCAAWVIYNENMDYLHCDDLSWDGKKKCD